MNFLTEVVTVTFAIVPIILFGFGVLSESARLVCVRLLYVFCLHCKHVTVRRLLYDRSNSLGSLFAIWRGIHLKFYSLKHILILFLPCIFDN